MKMIAERILVEDMPVVRMCFSVMSTGEDEELIEEEMNKLLAERYGIQIDIVKQLDNTQLNLMLTGGERFDRHFYLLLVYVTKHLVWKRTADEFGNPIWRNKGQES